MVDVAQLVRATDCGSVGRGFEPHLPPAFRDSAAAPRSGSHFFYYHYSGYTPYGINDKEGLGAFLV